MTVAPGKTAPVASLTSPRISVETVCGAAIGAVASATHNTTLLMRVIPPPRIFLEYNISLGMPITIRPRHPLRILFSELVSRNLVRQLRLSHPHVSDYIANLLVDLTVTENLYRIRDARGKRLQDVGEMLIASNPLLEGRSFDY